MSKNEGSRAEMPSPVGPVGKELGAMLMIGDWGTGFRLTVSSLGDCPGLTFRGGAEAGGIVDADGGLLYLVGRCRSMALGSS